MQIQQRKRQFLPSKFGSFGIKTSIGTQRGYLDPRRSPKIYGFAALLVLLYFLVLYYKVFFFTHTIILVPYFVIMSFLILARFPLAIAYHPQKFSDNNNYTPSVTVVVPAYNEEDAIDDTIKAIVQSDYPAELLEVFVYNDGSSDGTKQEILNCLHDLGYVLSDQKHLDMALVNHYSKPDCASVTFFDCSVNKGKREGLYQGFTNAKGEAVMVIDSDTHIEKDCVREIVKPLADSRCAAVSGHTGIKNKDRFIGKMQEANYFVSYHLTKKSEALWANVTCLPGCGSVYRKSAVLPFIDEWRNQKFLGVRCTYGEDRGLTTLLLRARYNTVYTPAAVGHTICPDTLKKLWKQRIRWKKSFLRECLWQSKFMFKRPFGAAVMFYIMFAASLLSPFFTVFYLFVAPAFYGYTIVMFYILGICLVTLLYAFYAKIYTSFPLSWTLGWFLFNTLVLSFGTIWAWIFAIRNPEWGTR